MTQELIKIEIRHGQRAVDARELHSVLENKQRFADWIKSRIEKFGFVEKQDFEVFHNSAKNPEGGRPTIDYALSIDMAKELAMVENNDKGRKVRIYFIEKEKEARNNAVLPQNFSQALYLAAQQQEELERKQHQLELQQKELNTQSQHINELTAIVADMQQKVTYVDTILASTETVTVTQIAQDYGLSAKALNKKLAELNIQRKVNRQWILYAKYLTRGYVHSRSVDIIRANGTHDTIMNTEWTQKGRLFLYETLKAKGILPLIER